MKVLVAECTRCGAKLGVAFDEANERNAKRARQAVEIAGRQHVASGCGPMVERVEAPPPGFQLT